MQAGDAVTFENVSAFVGPLLVLAAIVIILVWYIVFVQRRRG